VNRVPVALADLTPRLRAIYRDRGDKTVFLIGAGSLRYGDVVTVIDAAKAAGLERVVS
jgi:biopolymer transport protein ExbD